MYNHAALMGRICNDLELKTTQQTNITVLSFRIAVDRSYQAKGEEKKVDFFNIVAWRSTAEFISRYFAKGKMILVDGELQTRQYTDKNGITQNVVELVVGSAHFTGEKKEQDTPAAPQRPPAPPSQAATGTVPVIESADEEDYPF